MRIVMSMVVTLALGAPAAAQERTAEERASQMDQAVALYVTGAMLAPLGNAAVATGSIGLMLNTGPDATEEAGAGWFLTILVGLAVWIAGGALLVAATELHQRARRWLLPNPNTPRDGGIRPPPGVDMSY